MNKEAEKTLQELIRLNQEEIKIDYKSKYEQSIVDYLSGKGYLEKKENSTLSGWEYSIKVTQEGREYQMKKRKEKCSIALDWIKYGITTIIAIIALIFSILK